MAEKVAEAVEKTEEISAELKQELEATVVPELAEDATKTKARKSFTIRKAPVKKSPPSKSMAKKADKSAKADVKADLKAKDDAASCILPEIVEELGSFDYNNCQFSLAYGILNDKEQGVPTGQKMLLMRWNSEISTAWFPLPPLFNQVIMRKLYDRKSEEDIDFLLKEFGHSTKG